MENQCWQALCRHLPSLLPSLANLLFHNEIKRIVMGDGKYTNIYV